jgi:pimeloyl-ACP methyl ester carboxylesterase
MPIRLRGAVALRFMGALAGLLLAAPAVAQFYDVDPSELPGKPGTVIRIDAFQSSPRNAQAYRVLYRSIGLHGEPIAVSGVVIHPLGQPPAAGRNIVAWAHPTTGVARKCAPSLWPLMFDEIPGLTDMLARGYVIAATDYPGLGTAGVHPYMVGESEGRAVLDAVRAAAAMPETGAIARFVVWGHSQGGHAALYTGELAHRYAPELTLLGVAAAAPATYLGPLFEADITSTDGRLLAAYALWSWSAIYRVPLSTVLKPQALPAFEKVAHDCIEAINQALGALVAERPLQKAFLKGDLTKIEPWRTFIARNTPGHAPSGVPYFLAQGTADQIVRPAITARFMQALCQQGAPVRFVSLPGASHTAAARASARAAVAWMADRFAGAPPPNNCRR